MKKCPKCKADIQENARFCLYCMTSFEEKQTIDAPKDKNKRWLPIIAAVLVLVLIIVGIFLLAQKDRPNNEGTDNSTSSSVSNNLVTSDDNTTSSEQKNSESQGNETSTPTSNNQTQSSSKNEGNTTNNSSGNTTTTPSQTTTVTYAYRDAKYGDDFSVSANLENAVVITGVKTTAADGKYIIPETLDGKKVVAIMALAFCDDNISSTVKTVIVPSSVKTIWNNAFANCYNLTDIYFCGNSIYTESQAFPEASKRNGAITIHCSADCSDREFRTYKSYITNYLNDTLGDYSILYEEWNG